MGKTIDLRVNGKRHTVEAKPNGTLLDVLRNQLGLTGTKYGCGSGNCGACTVLIDGRPVTSCLTLAVAVEGREITTIEGMAQNATLHPIQEEFIRHGAIQCGYCTPGLIMTASALISESPIPTREQIRLYIKGNLCRCTGYVKIVDAISSAAERLRRPGGEERRE
jgi:carbon-monoxide dehydrogenase small subunit